MKTTPVLTLVRLIQAVFAALLTGILSPENIHAQDYMGANAVLHKVEESCAKPNEKHEKDEPSKLRDDLKLFGQISVHLAPAEAATRWLELVDRAAKIQRQSAQNYNPSVMPITADDLMNVLPPPAVWNELAKAIAMRPPAKDGGDVREAGLRLLAATLTGDAAGRSREITNIQAKAAAADRQSAYFYREILGQLGQAVLTTSDDPDDILKSLGYQLAYTNGQDVCRLMMPNLILLIGAEKAEVFLRKALVTPKVMLEFRMPDETSRLAQKLALELMDQLKTPQWGLVNSLDAIDLYEALDKHFGGQTSNSMSLPGVANVVPDINPINQEDDDQKSSAEIYYMLGLISKNRTQEAVAVAKRLKGQNIEYMCDEAFKAMENAGYTSALDNFLHALLSQNPTLPFWDQYVETATHAGQTERMLILVRDTITHEGLSDNKQATLHKILFKALLAADDVDGGLQEARRLIALDATKQSNSGYNAGELGIMITQIGVLLQKPKLTEEGIGVAKKWLATHADQNSSNWETTSILVSLTKILFELKRGPEAESILTDALVNAVRTGNLQPDYSGNGGGPPRQILAELVTLYYQAGRYDNVLDLLEQSPNWSAKDLSELFELSLWGNQISMMPSLAGSSRLPIPYLAASSLVAKGRKEQAQKITDALLDREPGLDRGYELLLALNGAKAIPRLDELFERDQFEERPLIWKAYLLRQQNLLAEAEKILRQAIAIDPTDGEEGRGDRLRAYAELADVLEARGNKKEADFYHRIVKAVRLSEDADQFYMAGLLKRAGAMYQEALNSFSDAYCIQARLAIQLAALGKNEEAEEHYRRAYELMPDSFGRVESHCLGCERAFDGEHAQGIAEKVFTQLARSHPNKPQVYYLLGYLRQEQERYDEARTHYLTAVRLDPDYLNAWVRLQEVSEQTLVSPQERDEIIFNILRLDPLQKHAHVDFDHVSNLNRLWNAMADAASHQPPRASNLFTLSASKTVLEKKEAEPASSLQAMQFGMMERIQMERENLSPAFILGQTPFVHIAGEMIVNGNNDPESE